MSIHVDLLNLAKQTLAAHPDLPEFCSVHIDNYASDGPRMALHLSHSDAAAVGVARWAAALGTVVRLRNLGDYVHASAEVPSSGMTVEVWKHLRPDEARRLLALVGGKFNSSGRAYLDPACWSADVIEQATRAVA